MDYSVGSGFLEPETSSGLYERLSHTVWMVMTFWLEQLVLRGSTEDELDCLRQTVWDQILPYLTEKGRTHLFKTVYRTDHADN